MSAKIIVGSVAVLGVLAGGAIVAARMSGGDELPGDDAKVAGVVNRENLAVDNAPAPIVLDERDVTPSDEGDGARRGPNDRQGFQRDGGQFGGRTGGGMADMIARFDADGDGELNEEERRAAREAFRAEREERRQQWLLEQYDKDGDGVLSEAEQAQVDADREAREADRARREAEMKQRALDAYDADGDGELSREERQTAEQLRRDYMEKQRAEFMTRFDTNGDGEVNGDERMAIRDTMGQLFEEMRFVREFDQDGDNRISAADMPAYMELFWEGDRRADVNRDGNVDEADLADFRQRVLMPPSQDILTAMDAWNNAPPPVDGGGWGGGDRGGDGGGFNGGQRGGRGGGNAGGGQRGGGGN